FVMLGLHGLQLEVRVGSGAGDDHGVLAVGGLGEADAGKANTGTEVDEIDAVAFIQFCMVQTEAEFHFLFAGGNHTISRAIAIPGDAAPMCLDSGPGLNDEDVVPVVVAETGPGIEIFESTVMLIVGGPHGKGGVGVIVDFLNPANVHVRISREYAARKRM